MKHRATEKKEERSENPAKDMVERLNVSNDKNYVQRRTRGKRNQCIAKLLKL
eukprot:UN11948